MKKYHVATTGYAGYITMTAEELRAYVREESKKARRYFGTAVAHRRLHKDGDISIDITARKDQQSASWARIIAHKH